MILITILKEILETKTKGNYGYSGLATHKVLIKLVGHL